MNQWTSRVYYINFIFHVQFINETPEKIQNYLDPMFQDNVVSFFTLLKEKTTKFIGNDEKVLFGLGINGRIDIFPVGELYLNTIIFH